MESTYASITQPPILVAVGGLVLPGTHLCLLLGLLLAEQLLLRLLSLLHRVQQLLEQGLRGVRLLLSPILRLIPRLTSYLLLEVAIEYGEESGLLVARAACSCAVLETTHTYKQSAITINPTHILQQLLYLRIALSTPRIGFPNYLSTGLVHCVAFRQFGNLIPEGL